jgi:hypothetical protein
MALVQASLKSKLLNLFNAMKNEPMSEAGFADQLAAVISDHIKTATVRVNAGIAASAPGTGSLP